MTQNSAEYALAGKEDIAGVSEVENECFSRPWGLEELAGELERPYAVLVKASLGKTIAGYADMHVVEDDAHINNIAVRGALRRRGIGRGLLDYCLKTARASGARIISLEVRAGNLAAIAMYESAGFEKAGLRRRFYSDPVEDGIIMNLFPEE